MSWYLILTSLKINKMAKNKKEIKKQVDFEELKSFGITKDPNADDIEEIDGEEISGGMDTSKTIETHWPTTGKN